MLSGELKGLILEGRTLQSLRAVKVRHTLTLKGKSKVLIARRGKKGLSIRIKTGKDILRNKVKALRSKHSPLKKRHKQKRAFKLTDKGIRA